MLATGGLFQLFENVLDLKIPFLAACILGWGAYVWDRLRREPALAVQWGLGRRDLGPATRTCGLILVSGALLILSWRLLRGWQGLPVSALAIFALYPLWALAQQFALQVMVVRNLELLGWPAPAIVVVGGVGFALAHLPDLPLMGLTWLAGMVWVGVYLHRRNLWPLALCHAWLGTLTYYWLLERDPWQAMIPV